MFGKVRIDIMYKSNVMGRDKGIYWQIYTKYIELEIVPFFGR